MDMKTKLNDSDLKELQWYLNRSNHGYGKLSTESQRFLRLGLLAMHRVSRYSWVLSITESGRSLLREHGFAAGDAMIVELTTKQ